MQNFNEQCKSKNCKHYIEWNYDFDNCQPYTCVSCELQGQSYDIEKIADDCPHKQNK